MKMTKGNAFLSRKGKVTRSSNLVMFKSKDPDHGGWEWVKPEDFPEELNTPETIGCMVGGDLVSVRGTDVWYRAEEADEVAKAIDSQSH